MYGDAIEVLADAYSKIYHLERLGSFSDIQLKECMVHLCNILKKIFDRKTGADCSVSIKMPYDATVGKLNSRLLNLCRDTNNSNRDTLAYNETKHTIIRNTPFRYIMNRVDSSNEEESYHYINNDIATSNGYDNTSLKSYKDNKLPYNSEFVFPIIPIINNGKIEFIGFICIDCNKKDLFSNVTYEIPMMRGVADAIFP